VSCATGVRELASKPGNRERLERLTMARKKEKFSRYDVVDYLKSEEDIAAYLDACIEEAGDDAAYIAAALGDIARARGMAQLAKDTGISREGLYKALSPDGNPSLATVLKVVKALGLKLTTKVA
jgi:probable addiction module antidote protein